MNIRPKHLGFFVAVLLISYTSHSIYNYYFDTRLPELAVLGVADNGCYAGDMQCSFVSSKKGDVSVWLDGQPLINKFRVYGNKDTPFVVPTKPIANGPHALRIAFEDATYRRNNVMIDRTFHVDNLPLQAAFLKSDAENKVFQGRTLHMQFQVNKPIAKAEVRTLSQVYPCFPESKDSSIYECYIPVECEEKPNEYLMNVAIVDRVGNSLMLENKFQVVMFPFKKEILKLDAQKVKEEKEIGSAPKELENAFIELTQKSPQEKLWRGTFCTPIDIARTTCDFGVIRTTQEKGRYAHKALDVVNNVPKSVVWATQDGIIALKGRFVDTGNTVIIDHGFGVLSMFCHLDSFTDSVVVGEKIAKGKPLGVVGKTGYATGYHLHWEMRVNNIAVDPIQWTKSTF